MEMALIYYVEGVDDGVCGDCMRDVRMGGGAVEASRVPSGTRECAYCQRVIVSDTQLNLGDGHAS